MGCIRIRCAWPPPLGVDEETTESTESRRERLPGTVSPVSGAKRKKLQHHKDTSDLRRVAKSGVNARIEKAAGSDSLDRFELESLPPWHAHYGSDTRPCNT
jgi:hypothetical protein